jgi:hypothetical protein
MVSQERTCKVSAEPYPNIFFLDMNHSALVSHVCYITCASDKVDWH